MTGATIITKSLEDLGVEHIFGYTGAAILPVMDELGKSPIHIVVNANEQCAAFAAAGYSRSSDRVGIVIVTSGPAITNALTDDMIFTTGVGNHQLLAAQYLRMKQPKRFLTSGSFGTMGFGMPEEAMWRTFFDPIVNLPPHHYGLVVRK